MRPGFTAGGAVHIGGCFGYRGRGGRKLRLWFLGRLRIAGVGRSHHLGALGQFLLALRHERGGKGHVTGFKRSIADQHSVGLCQRLQDKSARIASNALQFIRASAEPKTPQCDCGITAGHRTFPRIAWLQERESLAIPSQSAAQERRFHGDWLSKGADAQARWAGGMIWLGMLALGLLAGTLSGIVGFGSSIMLMPILMLAFGPQEAVPIMAIAALLANFSRVLVWWRDIDWRANAYYCVTAIPMAALGARTLLVLDARVVEGVLGGLFLLMIPARRWLFARGMRVEAWHLTLVGAVIGFLSGMVASTGPINTPFFLAYGLVKGAYLATEALGSMAIGLTKAIVFQRFDALPLETVTRGLFIGASLMVGSRLAKGFVLRLDADQFRLLMDLLLAGAGLVLLWGAFALPH
jgi:uncharacterized membrane protein YfcA